VGGLQVVFGGGVVTPLKTCIARVGARAIVEEVEVLVVARRLGMMEVWGSKRWARRC
jgi:hypothetical protein